MLTINDCLINEFLQKTRLCLYISQASQGYFSLIKRYPSFGNWQATCFTVYCVKWLILHIGTQWDIIILLSNQHSNITFLIFIL